MFLEKPKTLNDQISHHNKKFRSVVNKIEELGGIEDTLKSTATAIQTWSILSRPTKSMRYAATKPTNCRDRQACNGRPQRTAQL